MTQQNRETLLALADRAEKATEPSFDLFAEAFEAIHGERATLALEWSRLCSLIEAEAWLDAAMSLVPEGMIAMVTNTSVDLPTPDLTRAAAFVGHANDPANSPTEAATMALALCAAALRATASSLATPITGDQNHD